MRCATFLGVNGEIYNHVELKEKLEARAPGKHKFLTGSDCEVLLHLYAEDGPNFLSKNEVCGMYAFVIWDVKNKSYIVARDPVGIIPLYMGYSKDGSVHVASELKALHKSCSQYELFPPGHILSSTTGEKKPFYEPVWVNPTTVPTEPIQLQALRNAFEKAVVSHLMSDVPYGVLLSGGLDSSLVASIMSRHCHRRIETDGQQPAHWPQLHSFSIGLHGSPDLKAAKEVAQYLGSVHHEYVFTPQEGLDALADVIYHLETFDVTTIRASTPMYLMARRIRATGVKMVLSGEGADEIFGGYLYFHKAPNKVEFHKETVNMLLNLHYYDCLRANKSMSAFGVEPRVPFLDKDFLEYVMNLDPEVKMCKVRPGDENRGSIEKFIMRKAFDTPENPYLPEEVLWRQKEQFSDGVGYGWIDGLKDEAQKMVTDEQMVEANIKKDHPQWGDDIPDSKEAYWYRCMFDEHFPPHCASTVMRWTPTWSKQSDPSGRAISIHNAKYDNAA